MLVSRAGIHKLLVRIANRKDPDQTASESDLGLHYLSRPFLASNKFKILVHLPYFFQVRAGESLMKLVSDLKQFLILNDFPSVNESISNKTQLYKHMQNDLDSKLLGLRDELATHLYELEDEYYSSAYK